MGGQFLIKNLLVISPAFQVAGGHLASLDQRDSKLTTSILKTRIGQSKCPKSEPVSKSIGCHAQQLFDKGLHNADFTSRAEYKNRLHPSDFWVELKNQEM